MSFHAQYRSTITILLFFKSFLNLKLTNNPKSNLENSCSLLPSHIKAQNESFSHPFFFLKQNTGNRGRRTLHHHPRSRAKKTKKGGINVAPQRSRQAGTREHFVNISGSKSVARFPSVTRGCLPWERGERYTYIPGSERERERRNEGEGEKTFSNIRRSLCISSKVRRLSRRRWMVVDVEGWRV